MGTVIGLSEEVIAVYNAPFPSEEYKVGARIFPSLVPYLPASKVRVPHFIRLEQVHQFSQNTEVSIF
jgi:hypothetical protein